MRRSEICGKKILLLGRNAAVTKDELADVLAAIQPLEAGTSI